MIASFVELMIVNRGVLCWASGYE